jgi:hypothetical protein
MVELSIRIRKPVNTGQDLLNMNKLIKISLIITTVFAVLAVCCMILFTVGITHSLNRYLQGCKTECNSDQFQDFMTVFGTTTAAFYTILAIAMGVCYLVMNKTL